jgi:DNA-binding NtrC family response regulator
MVVDDDPHVLGSLVEVLRRKGYDIEACTNGNDAVRIFRQSVFDLVISDVKMPQMSGIELLETIKKIDSTVPFIIMTAFGDVSLAVNAMKKGAFDFFEKGIDILEKLEFSVERALHHRNLVCENVRLKKVLQKQWQYIGKSGGIDSIRTLIQTIAPSRSTILITGESGTGKELIARSIHYLSPRQNSPFVKINCAALPEGLIESELFGHEKGAFTGALRSKAGKFEIASGGTLLLDEIGEMPMGLQAKLLRVLQEREINKVGGDEPIEVDVRIVATSNRDLESEILQNKFREDLYYRLNVFHIHLPPLRERRDDIAFLVEHFIEKYNEENGFNVTGIEDTALKLLQSHVWHGNIRELENAIERAVVLSRFGILTEKVFQLRSIMDGKDSELTPGMTIAEGEKRLILKTLDFCNNNRTKAAEMLDISIRTLRNKLHEYGIKRDAVLDDDESAGGEDREEDYKIN